MQIRFSVYLRESYGKPGVAGNSAVVMQSWDTLWIGIKEYLFAKSMRLHPPVPSSGVLHEQRPFNWPLATTDGHLSDSSFFTSY